MEKLAETMTNTSQMSNNTTNTTAQLKFNSNDDTNTTTLTQSRQSSSLTKTTSKSQKRRKLPHILNKKQTSSKDVKRKISKRKKVQTSIDEIEFNEIPEIELSLSSDEDTNNQKSMTDDQNRLSLKEIENEENVTEEETRPRGAKFERRPLSVITDTDGSLTTTMNTWEIKSEPISIKKRTKAFQKKFEPQPKFENPPVTLEHLPSPKAEAICIIESESELTEVDDFDSRFVYQFDDDFLRSKRQPSKQIEILHEKDEREISAEAEKVGPVEEITVKQTRSRIDFNLFKFFTKKYKFRLHDRDESKKDDGERGFMESADDWLLKWCIFGDLKQKHCERVFRDYDWSGKGFLIGQQLLLAIEAISKLDNLKMNYLFSVLKLCDADPLARGAGPQLFTVICALANRIEHLDDDWFDNMLPALDLSTVENKMFKVNLRVWIILKTQI